jgi:hypothetical protein
MLIFEGPAEAALDAELDRLIEQAEWDHNRLKVIVPSDHSDVVLKALLKRQFKLRAMEGMEQ